jgi:hypothetical protein
MIDLVPEMVHLQLLREHHPAEIAIQDDPVHVVYSLMMNQAFHVLDIVPMSNQRDRETNFPGCRLIEKAF